MLEAVSERERSIVAEPPGSRGFFQTAERRVVDYHLHRAAQLYIEASCITMRRRWHSLGTALLTCILHIISRVALPASLSSPQVGVTSRQCIGCRATTGSHARHSSYIVR
jgi:hypothetical protein